MIYLKKLFSPDGHFQTIEFNKGVNLICGEKSTDSSGNVTNAKQNGVGKSLSIELINYCLLKGQEQSRITHIPETTLPKESFVCLELSIYEKTYVIARNRNGEIRLTDPNGDISEFDKESDAKKELRRLFRIEENRLSLRDYLNFVIKEEDYSYRDFIKLYHSNYIELQKIHWYFFNLDLELLKQIEDNFEQFDISNKKVRNINKELKSKNLDINEVVAEYNDIESKVDNVEKSLDYKQVVESVGTQNDAINNLEKKLAELFIMRKTLHYSLEEIKSFTTSIRADFTIADSEIVEFFNKYKPKLAEIVNKDLKELTSFKNELLDFKDEIFNFKKDSLVSQIKEIDIKIRGIREEIERNYNEILNSKSNMLIKGLKVYRSDLQKMSQYKSLVEEYRTHKEISDKTKLNFQDNVGSLKEFKYDKNELINSFKDTFIETHKKIMDTANCNFDIEINVKFAKESFFKLIIFMKDIGSKGVNQLRAIIYDLSLLTNPYTSLKHKKFLIHDNLIFGVVDKDSSIKVLNFLNELNPEEFQYIATVNKDDYDYEELQSQFNFDRAKYQVTNLTKSNPLFARWDQNMVEELADTNQEEGNEYL